MKNKKTPDYRHSNCIKASQTDEEQGRATWTNSLTYICVRDWTSKWL